MLKEALGNHPKFVTVETCCISQEAHGRLLREKAEMADVG